MSFEIELKAHVYNRDEVISILNSLDDCKYEGHREKSDTYYKFPLSSNKSEDGKNHISARIRKERFTLADVDNTQYLFTYKKKERIVDSNGTEIEVNDENEMAFSQSPDALEVFFKDLGGTVSLKKEKSVEGWIAKIDGEYAHIELCTVPPLGDFLEIEIIKDENDAQTVDRCKKIEEKIFTLCKIPLNQIESRYYKDLLKAFS